MNTIAIRDWNTLRKSGFYESLTSNTQNSPGTHMYYWGINVGHTGNFDTSRVYHYNGQIAFAVNFTVTYPQVYVRSTYINGEGTWAKLIHSKGDHAIDGKLTAKEIEIKVVTGADFVFQPDYNLKPLSEVEQFVKTNKHLPEIPSERQMIEEGVNVTDMQIKLLQKIEELTLYMIEQEKSIQEQNKTILNLQQQLNKISSDSH
ncbi:hypothetical protein [Dysgonomonas sp. ZJ709]|uniref:hypothetical protein n=1 Tax=Dysgonomonas sp. ZJ709 TaxID=2709797 RepID=UPI0013ED5968|nr:hypothetical protein [Dysgonomonas sp. ZJ709]